MIIKGSQRGGARALAAHLLNERDNDHVELADVRGTAAEDLLGAFLEIEAVSMGTRAKQPFFSVQVSPPPELEATTDAYYDIAERIEAKFGLESQPRAVVFHEKEGRRHAHVVWSRVDVDAMKAIVLPYSKNRLREVSIDVCHAHGLELLPGHQDRALADQRNYDRPIWQQAKRLVEDPRDLKQIVSQAYQHSDSVKALQAALGAQALQLARGDSRGIVVVHHSGEVLSLARYAGARAKGIRERLGEGKDLPSVDEARGRIEGLLARRNDDALEGLKARQAKERKPYRLAVQKLRRAQRAERQALRDSQGKQFAARELRRGARLRKGLGGLWQRVTGARGRIAEKNRLERASDKRAARADMDSLIERQLLARRGLQRGLEKLSTQHRTELSAAKASFGRGLAARSQERKRGKANDNGKARREERAVRRTPPLPRLG